MLLEITNGWWFILSLFDLLWMSFTELKYWKIITNYKTAAGIIDLAETSDEIEADRKKASSNTSVIQFGFAYLIGFLVLLYSALNGVMTWTEAGLTFISFVIIHYSGNEDILYFIYNFIFNTIPAFWWETRKFYSIRTRKLPKELPWLYEDKQVWKFKIRPYMIRLFCGEKVPFTRLIICGILGWLIILAIHFRIWNLLG